MSKSKIMIVEDEPLIGLALQETLEQAGYTVTCVTDSADEVPQAFTRHQPDLILLDVRLRSYTDGTDAARRLRLISDIPFIFLTAYNTEEIRARAERAKPSAFLTKPVDEEELLAEIRKALSARGLATASS